MTPHENLEKRVLALEDGAKNMRTELQTNTSITASIKSDTQDLVDFARACSGLVVVSRWMGKALQWLAPIALVAVSVWAVIKEKKL